MRPRLSTLGTACDGEVQILLWTFELYSIMSTESESQAWDRSSLELEKLVRIRIGRLESEFEIWIGKLELVIWRFQSRRLEIWSSTSRTSATSMQLEDRSCNVQLEAWSLKLWHCCHVHFFVIYWVTDFNLWPVYRCHGLFTAVYSLPMPLGGANSWLGKWKSLRLIKTVKNMLIWPLQENQDL